VRLLVAATISYNVFEGIVAIAAGTIAGSTALVGFGLDSAIEVSSAAIVAWQFSARDPETRERTALRMIAFSFFALAAYVSIASILALLGSHDAETSKVGIVLAAFSLLIMPFLSYAQRKAGRELGSTSAVADSKQTLLCTYLSAVLLVGLVLNSLLGWSWADPIAGLVIAAVALKEGRRRGRATPVARRRARDRSNRHISPRVGHSPRRSRRGGRARRADTGTSPPRSHALATRATSLRPPSRSLGSFETSLVCTAVGLH